MVFGSMCSVVVIERTGAVCRRVSVGDLGGAGCFCEGDSIVGAVLRPFLQGKDVFQTCCHSQ